MIVNTFPVVRMIRCSFVSKFVATDATYDRIVESLGLLYDWDVTASLDALRVLLAGGPDYFYSQKLTSAEHRVLLTIVRWLGSPLDGMYIDAWDEQNLNTGCIAIENHNKGLGIMLFISVQKRKPSRGNTPETGHPTSSM